MPRLNPAKHFESLLATIHTRVFHLNYFRLHLLYFVSVILLSSVIVYGSGVNGNSNDEEASFYLTYVDALFLCTSAMTSTGLNTVNLGAITTFQQAVLFILIFIGNVVTISVVTVAIRRHYYRVYMKDFLNHSKAGRQIVDDIDRQPNGQTSSSHVEEGRTTGSYRQEESDGTRRSTEMRERKPAPSQNQLGQTSSYRPYETGHGGFPYPWEISSIRNLRSRYRTSGSATPGKSHHYLSFQPSVDHKGRFHSLNEAEREELGGVEYRALSLLLWLLPAYIIFWLALPMVILIPYSYVQSVQTILQGSQPGNLSSGWWATSVVISAFGNCGLDILNENMIPFQAFYLVLIVTGTAILAGNTFFPIFLRIVIWAMSKVVSRKSRLHHTLMFLLHHPRRCFFMLFPATNTWWLAAIQASMHIGLWIFWIILQINLATVWSIPAGPRTISGLFQALGVRTGGFYIISLADIAPALQVLYVGTMHISGLPVILSLRSTNTYEERSIGVKDNVGKSKSNDDGSENTYISTHLKNQLASDALWLFLAVFLICIIERDGIGLPAPGFSIWSVIFDTVSAFGTVGLSTGVPYDNYSFCGAWFAASKVVLMAVMLRGRHRGLPMAIDRAVLLPGQELMERMDRDYNGNGDEGDARRGRAERKVREEEGGGQAEGWEKGQDPEQDEGGRMRQEGAEEDAAQTA
ncbi:hypothetical protein MMC17_004791 [Xylographa soralifera]|nr:hypothetical protein [Xylographa soralifera]